MVASQAIRDICSVSNKVPSISNKIAFHFFIVTSIQENPIEFSTGELITIICRIITFGRELKNLLTWFAHHEFTSGVAFYIFRVFQIFFTFL